MSRHSRGALLTDTKRNVSSGRNNIIRCTEVKRILGEFRPWFWPSARMWSFIERRDNFHPLPPFPSPSFLSFNSFFLSFKLLRANFKTILISQLAISRNEREELIERAKRIVYFSSRLKLTHCGIFSINIFFNIYLFI